MRAQEHIKARSTGYLPLKLVFAVFFFVTSSIVYLTQWKARKLARMTHV
jgi:hypothetical protein